MSETPQGAVVVVISPNGDVLGTGTDFSRSGYGGFKLHKAQWMRANQRAWTSAIRGLMSPSIAKCLTEYEIEKIWRAMEQHGWKLHGTLIGWPEADVSNG